jgi:cytochrome d ubiquinol oxidase subunit I
MVLSALLLSRLQFAFTISFHIIFPSFTIGLAMWLTVLEALHLRTGCPAYRVVFEFWLKIFGVAFRAGRGLRHCDGIPVRHELECAQPRHLR